MNNKEILDKINRYCCDICERVSEFDCNNKEIDPCDTCPLTNVKRSLENWKDYFVITRVHRDDLDGIGFDVSEVTDCTMERLASKMANDYLEQLYWIQLPILAEDLDIPKKEKVCCQCHKEGLNKEEYQYLDGDIYCLECYEEYKDE